MSTWQIAWKVTCFFKTYKLVISKATYYKKREVLCESQKYPCGNVLYTPEADWLFKVINNNTKKDCLKCLCFRFWTIIGPLGAIHYSYWHQQQISFNFHMDSFQVGAARPPCPIPPQTWSTKNSTEFLESRSSCPEVFCKKSIFRNFAKFTGKHPFLIKLQASGLQLY